MLQFYNTMSRKKERFEPIDDKLVRIYSCGLTVYDYAHIGNLRAFIFVDLLRRWLEFRGFRVKHVMNLTDVDDKTIRGMKQVNISLEEYTQKYIDAFLTDLKLLNIKTPHVIPKATQHIEDMIKIIDKLIEGSFGYKADDGSIYFSISKFKNYGKLSRMKLEELKAGARVRVDEYGKKHVSDFALWKAWDQEDRDVFWNTKLGKGRPGWSIECSAMSMKYLGEYFDIHTGGVDLIFPHHENEIAQSEATTGKKFVNFWLHNEHLLIKGERMGKSLRNFYTLQDLISKGHDPTTVRFFLLSTHYRRQYNFSFEGLQAAKNALQRIYDFMERLENVKEKQGGNIKLLIQRTRENFEKAMDDDLDIGKALAAVFNLVRNVNTLIDQKKIGELESEEIRNLMMHFDRVLGILSGFTTRIKEKLSAEIEDLINLREQARKLGDWEKADSIRNKLRKKGILLEDLPEGVKWKRTENQT